MVVDELGYGGGGDVVDEGEGGKEEDGCGTVVWRGAVIGGKGHVGGGEHEFLFITTVSQQDFRVGEREMRVYPIARLDFTVSNRFHHTPLLVTHILDPIRLPRRYKHVGSESIYVSI